MKKLTGKTLLITGGGQGIGLAFAKKLTQMSNTVLICGRNLEKLQHAKKMGHATDYFECDLTKDDSQEALLAFIQSSYPNTTILINNAGIQNNYDFLDGANHINTIEKEINTNFTSQVKLIDRFLPLFKKQQKALIINITSVLAVVPKQSSPVYCATKAAMRIFTKALRYQLEKTSIHVVEIVPPLVDTQMTKGRGTGKIHPDDLVKEAISKIEKNHEEIRIGKSKILFMLDRFFPFLANKIIRKG